jgi:beta-galactosidase
MLRASGGDVAILRAEVVDARGRPVPDGADLIRFSVSGPADVIGVGNGDPTSLEPDHARERRAFHGLAQALVRTRRRAGPITVSAEAPDLTSAQVRLISAPD